MGEFEVECQISRVPIVDNEEKAGLEHRLSEIGQLKEIYLAEYADKHVDGKPIVVVHQE